MGANNLMDQVKKMQADAQRMQAELKSTIFEGTSGGGAVTVKVTGDIDLTEIKIKPEILKPEEAEMVEDLVMAAFSAAISKAKAEANNKMGAVLGQVELPPGLI